MAQLDWDSKPRIPLWRKAFRLGLLTSAVASWSVGIPCMARGFWVLVCWPVVGRRRRIVQVASVVAKFLVGACRFGLTPTADRRPGALNDFSRIREHPTLARRPGTPRRTVPARIVSLSARQGDWPYLEKIVDPGQLTIAGEEDISRPLLRRRQRRRTRLPQRSMVHRICQNRRHRPIRRHQRPKDRRTAVGTGTVRRESVRCRQRWDELHRRQTVELLLLRRRRRVRGPNPWRHVASLLHSKRTLRSIRAGPGQTRLVLNAYPIANSFITSSGISLFAASRRTGARSGRPGRLHTRYKEHGTSECAVLLAISPRLSLEAMYPTSKGRRCILDHLGDLARVELTHVDRSTRSHTDGIRRRGVSYSVRVCTLGLACLRPEPGGQRGASIRPPSVVSRVDSNDGEARSGQRRSGTRASPPRRHCQSGPPWEGP